MCILSIGPPARASSLACFRTMEEYAFGSGIYLPERFMLNEYAGSRGPVRADAASVQLYGIPGLRVDAAGVRLENASFACAVHGIVLSSPIGGELSLCMEASAVFLDRMQSAVALQYHATRLDRFETTYRAAAALKMCARMTKLVTAGYTVDNVAVAGEKIRGLSASAFVYGHALSCVGIFVSYSLDGVGRGGMGTGVVVHSCAALRLVIGYDDGPQMLRGAASVRAGRFLMSVGAGIHPVLGVTKGVSLGADL
jgi:hypothetical protein